MRDIDRLIDAARQQRWGVERRKSGHFMLTPPSRGSPLIVVAGTPSDHRAYAKIRAQLKRAGLVLPDDHTPKETSAMPRRQTTPTKTSRSQRASAASAKAAVTRVPRTNVVDALPTPLSRADEARFAAEQRALAKGDTLQAETKLDRDLAHLADPNAGRRTVTSRQRRAPQEQALVYRGSRTRGALVLVAQEIEILVPDEDNDARVAEMQAVIPGMDEDSQRAAWAAAAALRNREPEPYVPLAERLILSGIHYHFSLGKSTLVHEDDVDYVLAYPAYRIERVGDINDKEDALPPAIVRRNTAAATTQRQRA